MIEGQGVTSTKLAYIAGVLDGEGTLIIGKWPRKGNRLLGYRGCMAIANTYLPVLEYIQVLLGGSIVLQSKFSGPYAGTRCYSLTFTTNSIRQWLPKLLPYLIIKKTQAEVLLAFLARQASNASAPVSDDLLAFYEECYQRLKEIKRVRFGYVRPQTALVSKSCAQCGKEFQHSLRTPKRLYCSNWCKRKTHWTRSNHRIADGRPAWAVLSHSGVSQVNAENREN